MIRTCFLLLCFIQCFGNVSAQVSSSHDGFGKSSIVEWALQQQLVLNEQPGKNLRLGISDGNGDYVVYTYEKLNDSIYREKVEESSIEISSGQLYIKRGTKLFPCFLWKGKYTESDWSAYSDSSGYLVKETLRVKRGDSIKKREVVRVDINGNATESWTSHSGTNMVEYSLYSGFSGNCSKRTVYSITGTDSLKTVYSLDCYGNGAEQLTDKKVFIWSWIYNSPIDVSVDEWIIPSDVKQSFDLVDFASEPTMIDGKLVKDTVTKLRTDKNGIIKRITITTLSGYSTTVGFNWQD